MTQPSICEQSSAQMTRELRRWFASEPGERLCADEKRVLAAMSEEGVFGYHLVQLQDFGHGLQAFDQCAIQHRLILGLEPHSANQVAGVAIGEHLPLAADSVDLMVLPHTLDFSLDPHQVLREVDRVLIPEGKLLIVGFNPLSLWGIWRLVLRWRGDVPWCGHFLSYRRLRDWLGLLGMDVEQTDVCGFVPPVRRESWHRRLSFLDRLGRRLWPMLAGVYAVRAVKRVSTVRPIKTRWRDLRVLGSATEPAPLKPTGLSGNGATRTTENA